MVTPSHPSIKISAFWLQRPDIRTRGMGDVLELCPLVVDLDGTLIHTDMLHESALRVFRDSPFHTLKIPLWLSRGKAVLKQNLASRTGISPNTLPYNEEFVAWLKSEQANGRKLVLCTATDHAIAKVIADHLDIFDEVIASDGIMNVAGKNKADALERRFGNEGFDYAGNSSADIAVWERARRAVVVNATDSVKRRAEAVCDVEQVFPPRARGVSAWRKTLRMHQWLKNALLFVPLLAGHELVDTGAWMALMLAFIAFSMCASSVYIANDLLDLESDRLHPRKRNRPFASGLMPAWMGVAVAPLLLLASLGIGSLVGGQFLAWLVVYFLLTCLYSWTLKRLILVDCITLALLYTLRIIAGAAAVGHTLSFWLLAFSVFLFLSLAFVKRYAELEVQLLNGKQTIHGRGYLTADAPLIQSMGVVAGYASVLVLALYLNSDAVIRLYRAPDLIWGAVLSMLFWVSWMWLQAHRGNMHDDPLVFAVKDRASRVAGAVFALVLFVGSIGLPW